MRFVICIGITALFISCTKQKSNPKIDDGITANQQTCYRYINNKDTVELVATFADSTIAGVLVYKLFEKDKNTGTIQGYMKDDLLIADYSFTSEGINSIRQVVFKKMDGLLVEGHGEVAERSGKTVFETPDSLNYNNAISLKPIDCDP